MCCFHLLGIVFRAQFFQHRDDRLKVAEVVHGDTQCGHDALTVPEKRRFLVHLLPAEPRFAKGKQWDELIWVLVQEPVMGSRRLATKVGTGHYG